MAYVKHVWEDLESGGTLITAQKLNEMEQGIADAQTGGVHVDDEMSDTSESPVQNKVITKELRKKLNEVGGMVETFVLEAMEHIRLYSKGNLARLELYENDAYLKTQAEDASGAEHKNEFYAGNPLTDGAAINSDRDIKFSVNGGAKEYTLGNADINGSITGAISAVNEDLSALKGDVSEEYNASKSYVAGDFCIYQNQLYRVKANCSGVTPPNDTYYEPTTVGTEISELKNSLVKSKVFSVTGDGFNGADISSQISLDSQILSIEDNSGDGYVMMPSKGRYGYRAVIGTVTDFPKFTNGQNIEIKVYYI